MKIRNYLIVFILVFGLIFSVSSCVVVNTKHDNGLHKGWYKPKKTPAHKGHKAHYKSEQKGNHKHDKDKKKKGKK